MGKEILARSLYQAAPCQNSLFRKELEAFIQKGILTTSLYLERKSAPEVSIEKGNPY